MRRPSGKKRKNKWENQPLLYSIRKSGVAVKREKAGEQKKTTKDLYDNNQSVKK